MKRGKFIVIDGIDGCGKSTQVPVILKYLHDKSKYNHVLVTREPYKSREIREILRQKEDAYSQAKKLAELFIQDRKEHIEEIILPALERGLHVISDRYKYSTIAFQTIQGIPVQDLVNMHESLLVPDLAIIFDVPSPVSAERMNGDNRKEHKFEADKEFQEKVRQKYLEMPKFLPGEKIIIIDATKSIEEVKQEIISILDRTLDL
jgi:dTMP kinase